MDQKKVNPPKLPRLLWKPVLSDVEQFGEKRQLFPDLLLAEVPGGVLVALHGTNKSLTFVPNVTYATFCEGAS